MDSAQLLGNLGEFIGSIVIIATLIYLAMQVRQNSEHLAAQSRYNYCKGRAELAHATGLNRDIAEIVVKGRTSKEISLAEFVRVEYLLSATLSFWEYEFWEYEEGRISEDEFNPAAKRFVFQRDSRGYAPVWHQYKITAPRRFVEYVDKHIANP
jgi:hypothetical protein